MFLYAAAAGSTDPNARLILSVKSDEPYTSWKNRPDQKELDSLIMRQLVEMNPRKREALLRRIYRLLAVEPGGAMLLLTCVSIKCIHIRHSPRHDFSCSASGGQCRSLHSQIQVLRPGRQILATHPFHNVQSF